MAEPLPTELTAQVTAFHRKFGFAVRTVPTQLSEVGARDVEHRLRLVTSEFCEVLRAFGLAMGGSQSVIEAEITRAFSNNPGQTWGGRLHEIAQELADLDYVVEGTRLTLGIPRKPVAVEVHRANMEKEHALPPSPVKPAGWRPPEVEALLERERVAAAPF